jgi:hypothetical protein
MVVYGFDTARTIRAVWASVSSRKRLCTLATNPLAAAIPSDVVGHHLSRTLAVGRSRDVRQHRHVRACPERRRRRKRLLVKDVQHDVLRAREVQRFFLCRAPGPPLAEHAISHLSRFAQPPPGAKHAFYLLDVTSPTRLLSRGSIAMVPLHRDYLARIHDVEWIDRALERAHQFDCRAAVFALEILHLLLSDAVLAGAGPVHGDRPRDKPIDELLHFRDLLRVIGIDQRQAMEIPVADVADDGRKQAHLRDVALGFFDALR